MNIADTNKELEKFTDKHLHIYAHIRDSGDIQLEGVFTDTELRDVISILTEFTNMTNP